MNDGKDAPGKDSEIGRGNGSNRLSGYVSADDYKLGKYKPLREGVSLQYANREPRFYASVAYNGSFWTLLNETLERNRNQQVFYYRDDNKGNGFNSSNAYWLRTGFGVKNLFILVIPTKVEVQPVSFQKQNRPFVTQIFCWVMLRR